MLWFILLNVINTFVAVILIMLLFRAGKSSGVILYLHVVPETLVFFLVVHIVQLVSSTNISSSSSLSCEIICPTLIY